MEKNSNIIKIIIFFVIIAALGFYTADKFIFGTDSAVEQKTGQAEKAKKNDEIKEDRIQTVTIAAAGDIIYHMTQINSAYDEKTEQYDFKPFFELVRPYIEGADIAVANFEGTTGGTAEKYMAYPRFNIPDETLDAVKYAGFDILSTANNHSIDMRKEGIIRTLDQIHNRGMMTVGTYSEKPESRILIVEEKGIRIAFLAYTYSGNGMEATLTEEELDCMINIIDREKILEDISDAKQKNADIIIAFMHWWNDEYQREVPENKKELADFMLENGVDIILGSHPHVIQQSEIREYDGKKKFIIYSMGNFISNQRQETLDSEYPNLDNFYTEDGVIVNIEIEKNFDTNTTIIKKTDYTPTWVNRYKTASGKYHYDVIPVEKYLKDNLLNLDKNTLTRMERSMKDTLIKMEKEQ